MPEDDIEMSKRELLARADIAQLTASMALGLALKLIQKADPSLIHTSLDMLESQAEAKIINPHLNEDERERLSNYLYSTIGPMRRIAEEPSRTPKGP